MVELAVVVKHGCLYFFRHIDMSGNKDDDQFIKDNLETLVRMDIAKTKYNNLVKAYEELLATEDDYTRTMVIVGLLEQVKQEGVQY